MTIGPTPARPALAGTLLVAGCRAGGVPAAAAPRVEERAFGTTRDGVPVRLFTITNGRGMVARLSEYGVRRAGLALETQHFPDAVDHAHFPSAVLRPETTFRSTTVHAFPDARGR